MRQHSLSMDCTFAGLPNRSIVLAYDNNDPSRLWIKSYHLRDPEPDICMTAELDEESARSMLMFIQGFLLDLSRAKQVKKYGDSSL